MVASCNEMSSSDDAKLGDTRQYAQGPRAVGRKDRTGAKDSLALGRQNPGSDACGKRDSSGENAFMLVGGKLSKGKRAWR